jgi:phosphopantothenoylcysteine synthetase/decarboxylase
MSPVPALYVLTCGTLAATVMHRAVAEARRRGWAVIVGATPAAAEFIDQAQLAEMTGYPVRLGYREPSGQKYPPVGAILLAGASFNTINKWAAGISDTLVLGLLNEALGSGVPIVVLPFLNSSLANHPAFSRSIAQLRESGVRVLLGPGVYEPQPPGTGKGRLPTYPWTLALDELDRLTPR